MKLKLVVIARQFADNFKVKNLSSAALFLSIQPQRALSRPYALCRRHAI